MQKIIIGLALIYILTFLAGFLQDTPYNFVNYILFSLFFIGGIALISATLKSEATGMTRVIVLLTGISTSVLFILGIGYEWFRLKGDKDLEGSIEGLLYLLTLIFWMLVVVSLVLLSRIGGSDSS